MYNKSIMSELADIIYNNAGVGNKEVVAQLIKTKYRLQKKGAIYYGKDFAIRFSSTKSKSESVSNTVMALKHVKNYDSIPLLVCVVGPNRNYLRLANATFIKKVSHSSKNFRANNIVGNINYSDIMKEYCGMPNEPSYFEKLFEVHSRLRFDGNLSRLLEATGKISPTGRKFMPTDEQKKIILAAPQRAYDFAKSSAYQELKKELDEKTVAVESDIVLITSAYEHDVKLRGNLIEYFIKSKDEQHKEELRTKLKNKEVIDDIIVENGLGDYSVEKDSYLIEIDIKSKVDKLNSAPKGYNVDKLLEFLSQSSSVYLLYIVLINEDGKPKTELSSIFQKQILDKTRIQHHWSGRNSRGTAQFDGHALEYFIEDASINIEMRTARKFLEGLLDE